MSETTESAPTSTISNTPSSVAEADAQASGVPFNID